MLLDIPLQLIPGAREGVRLVEDFVDLLPFKTARSAFWIALAFMFEYVAGHFGPPAARRATRRRL
jgi:hypothetical protein